MEETSDPAIINHRRFLRREFVLGALAFAEKSHAPEKTIPLPTRAIEKTPASETLCAALIRAYVDLGYPSDAIRVLIYHTAREALAATLVIAPGPALRTLKKHIEMHNLVTNKLCK